MYLSSITEVPNSAVGLGSHAGMLFAVLSGAGCFADAWPHRSFTTLTKEWPRHTATRVLNWCAWQTTGSPGSLVKGLGWLHLCFCLCPVSLGSILKTRCDFYGPLKHPTESPSHEISQVPLLPQFKGASWGGAGTGRRDQLSSFAVLVSSAHGFSMIPHDFAWLCPLHRSDHH